MSDDGAGPHAPATDLERAAAIDAGEPCTLAVAEPGIRLSGLAEPRPLATWRQESDRRSPRYEAFVRARWPEGAT